jgi:hypothetical protein
MFVKEKGVDLGKRAGYLIMALDTSLWACAPDAV